MSGIPNSRRSNKVLRRRNVSALPSRGKSVKVVGNDRSSLRLATSGSKKKQDEDRINGRRLRRMHKRMAESGLKYPHEGFKFATAQFSAQALTTGDVDSTRTEVLTQIVPTDVDNIINRFERSLSELSSVYVSEDCSLNDSDCEQVVEEMWGTTSLMLEEKNKRTTFISELQKVMQQNSYEKNLDTCFRLLSKLSKDFCERNVQMEVNLEEKTSSVVVKFLQIIFRLTSFFPEIILKSMSHRLENILAEILGAEVQILSSRFPKDQSLRLKDDDLMFISASCEMIQSCSWLFGALNSPELSQLCAKMNERSNSCAAGGFRNVLSALNILNPSSSTTDSTNITDSITVKKHLIESGVLEKLNEAHELMHNLKVVVKKDGAKFNGLAIERFWSGINRVDQSVAWCIGSFSNETCDENLEVFAGAFVTLSNILNSHSQDLAVTKDIGGVVQLSMMALANLTSSAKESSDLFFEQKLIGPTATLMMHKDFKIRWSAVRTLSNVTNENEQCLDQVFSSGIISILKNIFSEFTASEYIKLAKQMEPSDFRMTSKLLCQAMIALSNIISVCERCVEQILFDNVSNRVSTLNEFVSFALCGTHLKNFDCETKMNVMKVVKGARKTLMNATKKMNDSQFIRLVRGGLVDVVMQSISDEQESFASENEREDAFCVLETILKQSLSSNCCGEQLIGYRANETLNAEKGANVVSYIMHQNDYWACLEEIKRNEPDSLITLVLSTILDYK